MSIIVLAIEFGRLAGVVAGLAALALFAVWTSIDGQDASAVAYVVRGDDAGRIIEVNEALIEITGLARDNLVGARTIEELTHPEDRDLVREGLERVGSGEAPTFRVEFPMLKAADEAMYRAMSGGGGAIARAT